MKTTIYYAGFIPNDKVFAVLFPDFLGCNSQGETLEEAFIMASEALEEHIECMADDNEILPDPSSQKEAFEKLKKQYSSFGLGELPKETVLFPIKVPVLDCRTKKVAVSFAQYKLEMIDRKAHTLGMTRSGFLSHIASCFDVKQYS